jgi:hypothetical protein
LLAVWQGFVSFQAGNGAVAGYDTLSPERTEATTMAKKKQSITVYVVQQYHWEYSDEYFYHDDDGEAIQTFRDRRKAETYRDELEREMQRNNGFGPFEMNGLEFEEQTSLTFAQFQKGVRQLGLETPADESDCFEWWHDNAEKFTTNQRFGVWKLMDKARFYEIVETELEVEV